MNMKKVEDLNFLKSDTTVTPVIDQLRVPLSCVANC
jgi:hypothetical protein